MGNALLQGMSNIMKSYPGHTIFDFFGDKPMTAVQFFTLNEQLMYEDELTKKEYDKINKKK